MYASATMSSSNEELSMFGTSHESMDKTDWNALDYTCCRDESWYRKHFPGFDEEIIRILVHCDGRMLGMLQQRMLQQQRMERML